MAENITGTFSSNILFVPQSSKMLHGSGPVSPQYQIYLFWPIISNE
jgi:hypothetical protein